MLEEFNIENNSVSALPDGLLAAVENLTFITISRNQVFISLCSKTLFFLKARQVSTSSIFYEQVAVL